MDGGLIKMAMPLHEDGVTYQDGTKATIEQQAHDVVNFLQWAAEPEMEERKSMGIHVMLFLGAMTCFFYLVKKRVWSDLH
jgi:ubiquinol-cytochrome c reductase cytochrome c1 subunit